MNKLFLALSVLLSVVCTASSSGQNEKPNIIYILADGLGYGDLSCYGQDMFRTPNIDRLAREGMLFTQHYAGSTVCAPSRSALMTGQHTGHTYIRGNKGVPLESKAVTVAEVLKTAGYTNGAFGKWGLGEVGSEGDPLAQGFDEFYGYNSQTLAHNYYPWFLWHNDRKITLEENRDTLEGLFAPFLIQEKVIEFIERNRERPFFCFVPSVIPHAELIAPEEYMELYRGKYLPEKVYEGCDPGCRNYKKGGYMSQDESHAAFVAMIHILDEQVGQIIDKVDELGLKDKTIIMFTSDNGPHLEGGADPDYFDSNGPFRGYKRDLYEGGIRVPMLVRWPAKVKAGSKAIHISAFWDILPTFAEVCGITPPANIDGISFLPTLLGMKDQREHEFLYWEFYEKRGRKAVRKDQWKAVQYEIKDNPDAPVMLFNLLADPGEEQDMASEYPQLVVQMKKMMEQAHTDSEIFTEYRDN